MKTMLKTLASAALFAMAASASAASVTSYDIVGARQSGFGGWNHSYSGKILPIGDTARYTGGSGTLNDGILPAGAGNNQLFVTADGAAITVFLDGVYKLSSLDFLALASGNGIPGNLTGVTVSIGAISQAFATVNYGEISGNDGSSQPINDRVDFTGSSLAGLATDRFTLSDFTAGGGFSDYYSIGEIAVSGAAAVPEPGTWAMMIAGIGAVGFGLRRRSARATQLRLA